MQLVDAASKARWMALERAARSLALQQSWHYGEALAGRTVEIRRFLALDEAGTPAALVQIPVRRIGPWAVATLLRGPAWVEGQLTAIRQRELLGLLREAVHPAVLVWEPDHLAEPASACGMRCVITGQGRVVLDLDASLTGLRKNLDGKWRNMLVQAERQAISIEAQQPAGRTSEWIFRLHDAQRSHRRYSAAPGAFYEKLCDLAGDPLVLTASLEDKAVAGVVFLRHGTMASYAIGVTTPAGRDCRAHHRLVWEAIRQLKSAGTTLLDLGSVSTDANPGLARFKLGTGGRLVRGAGTFVAPPRWLATLLEPFTSRRDGQGVSGAA